MRMHWLNGELCIKPSSKEEHQAACALGEVFAALGFPRRDNTRLSYMLGGGPDGEPAGDELLLKMAEWLRTQPAVAPPWQDPGPALTGTFTLGDPVTAISVNPIEPPSAPWVKVEETAPA